MTMNKHKRGYQTGFSMVELAVATAVFSMGLGSLSMMMMASVQGTAEASHRTVAATQAYSLAELIAMQSDAFGHYINPPGEGVLDCNEDFCRDEALASANMLAWQSHLARELPGSDGLVCFDSTPDDGSASDPSCDGSGALVVKVFWTETRHQNAPDGGQRRVVSRLPW
jgi:type IV pilus assembly protein PilV